MASEKTPGGRYIFICRSVCEIPSIYEQIKVYLREESSREQDNVDRSLSYSIIDKDQLWKRLKEGNGDEIRFGCVTFDTMTDTVNKLYENGIPILLIENKNRDDEDDKVKESRSERRRHLKQYVFDVSEQEFNKMVYKVEKPDQVAGAINWVHAYYYRVLKIYERKVEKEVTKKMQYVYREATANYVQDGYRQFKMKL